MSASLLLDRLSRVRQAGPNRWVAGCPLHGTKGRPLSIRSLDDGRILIKDFGGCSTLDVLAAVGLGLRDLFPPDATGKVAGVAERRRHTLQAQTKIWRPWSDLAAGLWDAALPLRGSLAETYLQGRNVCLPPEDGDLRFLPARGGYPAAMLARVTDAVTAEPISLHFTRLKEGGGKVSDRPKLLLAGHRKAGGVIRLWPDDAVTCGLAVAEGIESALAAAHGFTPVWSCIDAGNLALFPILDGIEALTVLSDNDEPGLKAARACAQRWANAGREARIAVVPGHGRDFADVAVEAA